MASKKRELYIAIQTHQHINKQLSTWLHRICFFCEKLGMTDVTVNEFFPSTNKNVCGHVTLSFPILQDIILYKNSNQRVILTTIYRFAKILPLLLWKLIAQYREFASVSNICKDFPMLSYDELRSHAHYVLQKHGLHINSASDPINTLYQLYLSNNADQFIKRNMGKYPTVLTSLTQPIGTDVTDAWMKYNDDVSVRMINVHIDESKRLSINDIESSGVGLCPMEKREIGSNLMLPWNTGSMLYYVNPNSDFYNIAKAFNKSVFCGPSCTTQLMLDCALLFGIDARVALLAIIPWMNIPRDHSVFEMLLSANPYIITLEYKLEKGGDDVDLEYVVKLFNELYPNTFRFTGGGGQDQSIDIINAKAGITLNVTRNARRLPPKPTKVTGIITGGIPANYCNTAGNADIPSLIADAWHPSINLAVITFKPLKPPSKNSAQLPNIYKFDIVNITEYI